ncbi:MAG: hypothetical protein ACI8R8_003156, partial [Paraglaciecola sp.]
FLELSLYKKRIVFSRAECQIYPSNLKIKRSAGIQIVK